MFIRAVHRRLKHCGYASKTTPKAAPLKRAAASGGTVSPIKEPVTADAGGAMRGCPMSPIGHEIYEDLDIDIPTPLLPGKTR